MTLRQAILLPLAIAAAALAFVANLEGAGQSRGDAAFAAALLMLVGAAATGPFLFDAAPGAPRWSPLRQGALSSLSFAASGALVCGWMASQESILHGAAAGALCGPFAFALGTVAFALGGGLVRAVVVAAGLALLSTLFWWDQLFLLSAADRKASAALAFGLNPAAAASVTLGFDWIHSKVLYHDNQTAESLVVVPLPGSLVMTLKLLGIGGGAGALTLLRRP